MRSRGTSRGDTQTIAASARGAQSTSTVPSRERSGPYGSNSLATM